MVSEERLKELIAIKNKQRAALKADYVKQITDPHKYAKGQGGALVSSLIFITTYKLFFWDILLINMPF